MTISLRQLLLILGLTLAAVGLFLGVMPISFDGGPCGAAFGSDRKMDVEALTRSMIGRDPFAFDAGCTDARSARRTVALALLLPGAILATASAFIPSEPKPARAAAGTTDSTTAS